MRIIDIEHAGTVFDEKGNESIMIRVSIGALRFNVTLSERIQMRLIRLIGGQRGASVQVPIGDHAFLLTMPKGVRDVTPVTLNVRDGE